MGLHPDDRRRAHAAHLRAEGLCFTDIGRRLGVSKQRTFAMVQAHRTGKLGLRQWIRCRECRTERNAKAALRRDDLAGLCVGCSAGWPLVVCLLSRSRNARIVTKSVTLGEVVFTVQP